MLIAKLFADNFRTVAESQGFKLKPSHAHELTAGFCGYKSKTSLLADTRYPLSNLHQASVITIAPPSLTDQRRNTLQDLPPGFPDTDTLAAWFYSGLLTEEWIASKFWPDYEKLAKFLADRHLNQMRMDKTYRNPHREGLMVEYVDDFVHLIVKRFYRTITENTLRYGTRYEANITITIKLQRIAAHIGYAEPEIFMHIDTITDLKHQYAHLAHEFNR